MGPCAASPKTRPAYGIPLAELMEPLRTEVEVPTGDVDPSPATVAAVGAPFSLAEIDRRVARFVWLERRRFELLGGWAPTVAELDVKALLATQAHHHAWHASLWEDHLPRRTGHDSAATKGAVDERLRAVIHAVGRPETTLERLVGAYRVLAAHAIAAYTRHLERSRPPGDAALARTCRLILADQLDDWRQGELALQSLLGSGDDVDRGGAHQVHLERLLVEAGGFAGCGEEGA